MAIDDLFTQIDGRFNSSLSGLINNIKNNITTHKDATNKIKSVYENGSNLKLEYNNDPNFRYDHDIGGLVDLFKMYLVDDQPTTTTNKQ